AGRWTLSHPRRSVPEGSCRRVCARSCEVGVSSRLLRGRPRELYRDDSWREPSTQAENRAQARDDVLLVVIRNAREHRQAERTAVIALCAWVVADAEAELAVVRLSRHGDVVHIDENVALAHPPENLGTSARPSRLVELNHVEMISGPARGALPL